MTAVFEALVLQAMSEVVQRFLELGKDDNLVLLLYDHLLDDFIEFIEICYLFGASLSLVFFR